MRLLLTCLLLLPGPSFAQQWNWAASAGGGGNTDFCQGIATDAQGNVYWVGSVSGTADFGCGTLTPGNTVAGFVAKRSANGTCLWVRGITVGFNQAWAYGVAIDAQDRIYVTGKYNGNANFGNGITLGSLGSDDIFLARYDSAGTCLWARRAGSSGSSDEARGVALSADGGIFIAGFSGGTTIGFDAISIPNPGNARQLVLARYDSTGTVQWARASVGSGQAKTCRGISVAGDRLYATGQIGFSNATYDGLALSSGTNGSFLYVLATDLAGNGQWVRSYGNGDNEGMAISADTLGNVFVAARLWGNLFLPTDTLASVSSNDDLLALKLDRLGNLHWAQSAGSAQRDLAWGVAADGKGNAYYALQFQNSIDLFGSTVTALGSEDALIAKLRGNGSLAWWSRPSGFQRDIPLTIHRQTAPPHALYFGGYYWGTITYGGSTITHVNNGDAMLVGGRDSTFALSTYAVPSCPGGCTGSASAFTNGSAPFAYAWSTGATTPTIGALCPGTYTVQVVDANGQVSVDSLLVPQQQDPGYTVLVQGDLLSVAGGSAWTWFLNGAPLPGDSASTLAATTGNYHALVTDALGCTWSSDTVQVLTTAVPGTAATGFSAWPNPMGHQLHVQHPQPGTPLQLLDALGRSVWTGSTRAGITTVPTAHLPPGPYLLRSASGELLRLLQP